MKDGLMENLRSAEIDARHNDWSFEKTIQYLMDFCNVDHETVMKYFKERGTL